LWNIQEADMMTSSSKTDTIPRT